MLKKYVATNQRDWDVKLPLVLMAARATPHQSTGVPPFTLMTGRNMTLPLHLLYQPGDLNLVTTYTTHQYLEELHQHLRTTFAFAQQQLQQSAEGRKAYYDRKASPSGVPPLLISVEDTGRGRFIELTFAPRSS